KLFADYNSVVKKGQVIAILDTTFLAASKDDASANVAKARAQAEEYQREFARAKKLYDEKVATQADYDLALTNLELGKANLQSAMAQLNRAKINLQYATIHTPITGTVISRNVDVGQMVISSFNTPTLFSIANNLRKMEVQANIDEADVGQIKIGQKALFTVDAYLNKTFEGKITEVRLQPVIIQNVVNYVVIIEAPNPDLKLMPGMTANITVKVQERKDVLKVPITALHFTPPPEYLSTQNKTSKDSAIGHPEKKITVSLPDSLAVVWTLNNEVLSPANVVTGISDGTYMEVYGDLKKDEVVVLGLNQSSTVSTTTNPFMPKMPTRRGR
ncbi:MAG TPA: efflux RND transporter periplasmic adaptor subunit, partial [Cytophagales bacterium]|nr:efflux RND transporter periplasmic adaptor subunit [Cytophagales bacterium]